MHEYRIIHTSAGHAMAIDEVDVFQMCVVRKRSFGRHVLCRDVPFVLSCDERLT